MKKLLLICVSVVCLASLSVVGCAKEAPPTPAPPTPPEVKPIVLTFSCWSPFVGFLAEKTEVFLSQIEERTEGRVKIERYWGGTLAKVKELHPLIERGGVDLGTGVSCYAIDMFPYSAAGFHAIAVGSIGNSRYDYDNKLQKGYEQLREEFPEVRDEFTNHDQKVLFFHEATPLHILSIKPVRTLADLDGLKVRAVGTSVKFDAAGGAVIISIPAVEAYEAMSKGVVDAVDTAIEIHDRYRHYEIAKHLTFGLNSCGQHLGYATVINLDTWNKLPPDIQEIIEGLGKEHGAWYSQEMEKFDAEGERKFVEEEGVITYDFPPADREVLMKEVAFQIYDDYVKKIEGMGFAKARQILDRYCELVGYDPYKYR